MKLKDNILDILKDNTQGLTVQKIVQELQIQNPKISPRGVRNLVGEMFKHQEISRRRQIGKRGKPAYVYFVGKMPNIFEELGVEATITTKSQMLYEMLPDDEKERHERGMNVLRRLIL